MKIYDKIFSVLKEIIWQFLGAVLIIIVNVMAPILAGVVIISIFIILEPILKPIFILLKFLLCS